MKRYGKSRYPLIEMSEKYALIIGLVNNNSSKNRYFRFSNLQWRGKYIPRRGYVNDVPNIAIYPYVSEEYTI